MFALYNTAIRSALLVALAAIHWLVDVGFSYFLADWKFFGNAIGLVTSGGFGVVTVFQMWEIVVLFWPWKGRVANESEAVNGPAEPAV
ncbi:MAG: hypothetical protein ABL986_19035 [Vicinamibacterales bacterium]